MAPSEHSSSSHSSSSSDSYGSSYSSHSSSSHSSDSNSYSYSGDDDYTDYLREYRDHPSSSHLDTPITRNVLPPERERSNQPTGFTLASLSASLLRSKKHDYQYYPEDWKDEETGESYKRGYYDEEGKHYRRVIIRKGTVLMTRAACDFCGTQVKLEWKEGALPSCPNCGAVLKEIMTEAVVEDEVDMIEVTDDADDRSFASSMKALGISAAIFVGLFVLGLMPSILKTDNMKAEKARRQEYYSSLAEQEPLVPTETLSSETSASENSGSSEETSSKNNGYASRVELPVAVEGQQSIYVESIGRTCYWHESGNFYDPETDCYFWYNTNVEPPMWQYWYEGISSDFGKFGWMEYDYGEKAWYVEESEGHWVLLPDTYDTSKLWFMTPVDGRFQGQDRIYVEEIGRYCDFVPEENNYYDEETKCHFWYNTYVENGIWQYWFEDIANEYGKGGWMEFDELEKRWYILVSEDKWERLPPAREKDYLWHIRETKPES